MSTEAIKAEKLLESGRPEFETQLYLSIAVYSYIGNLSKPGFYIWKEESNDIQFIVWWMKIINNLLKPMCLESRSSAQGDAGKMVEQEVTVIASSMYTLRQQLHVM